ncbi:hypothetical protein PVK06_034987 [Gossypium arboreum]|uniref:Uncharacterized protein n=1 Tax=Gossypium arboreum TaxID=29729 RepID=A0ABR0NFP8_GOSAR|nr:hypothetical protein PVK06_034987 [Gossypium arboreum]
MELSSTFPYLSKLSQGFLPKTQNIKCRVSYKIGFEPVMMGGIIVRNQPNENRDSERPKGNDVIPSANTDSSSNGMKNEVDRSNFHGPNFQEAPKSLSDPLEFPIGPTTNARAKRFKEALIRLMRGLWKQSQVDQVQIRPNLFPILVQVI